MNVRHLAAAVVAATLGGPHLVWAQQAVDPVGDDAAVEELLVPGAETPAVSQPLTLEAPQTLEPPSSAEPMAGQGSTDLPQAPADGSIQINVLDAIDIDSAGPLTAQDGGLGTAAWQAASMTEVEDLLQDLPSPIASDTLRDLTIRLLLSGAPAPIKLDQIGNNAGDFILSRLAALSSLGAFDELDQLLAVVPGADSDPRFFRWNAVASLMRGDVPSACARANVGTRESDDPFWQQLLVACQAMAGRQGEAELGLSLMRELDQVGPIYAQLVSSLIYKQPVVLDRPPRADPLLTILFNQSGAELSDDALSSLASTPADSLKSLLGAKHLDEETKITIAEALASTGAMDGETMRGLLERLSFDQDQLASPLSSAAALDIVRAIALLYQASTTQQIDAARAEAVAAAITRARDEGMYEATARAFLPVVRNIPARTDLVWFAEDAARILIMAGDTDQARGWIAILRSAALLDTQMFNAQVRLTPLLHLSGLGQRPLMVEEMDTWWQSVEEQPQGRSRAAMVFTMLDALESGRATPLWSLMGGHSGVRGGIGADLAIWHRLSGAAQADAAGLTVLLAIHLAGRSSLAEADPIVMQHVVRALVDAGLGNDARSLVLEMAVSRGL